MERYVITKTRKDVIVNEIPNFLTDEECNTYIELIDTLELHPGGVSTEKGNVVDDYARKAKTRTLPRTEKTEALRRKIETICGMTPYSSEGCVVIKYDVGDYFKLHSDYFHHFNTEMKDHLSKALNRIHTAIIYLNDDFEGGETTFPLIDTVIKPKKGTMVSWVNGESNGMNWPESQHTGEPILKGTKYILTFWMHVGAFDRPIFEEPAPILGDRTTAKSK